MERGLRRLEQIFRRRELENRPKVDINAIPQDEEIVLFDSVDYPLPNPFIAGFQSEDIRRQREAEHEQGV